MAVIKKRNPILLQSSTFLNNLLIVCIVMTVEIQQGLVGTCLKIFDKCMVFSTTRVFTWNLFVHVQFYVFTLPSSLCINKTSNHVHEEKQTSIVMVKARPDSTKRNTLPIRTTMFFTALSANSPKPIPKSNQCSGLHINIKDNKSSSTHKLPIAPPIVTVFALKPRFSTYTWLGKHVS